MQGLKGRHRRFDGMTSQNVSLFFFFIPFFSPRRFGLLVLVSINILYIFLSFSQNYISSEGNRHFDDYRGTQRGRAYNSLRSIYIYIYIRKLYSFRFPYSFSTVITGPRSIAIPIHYIRAFIYPAVGTCELPTTTATTETRYTTRPQNII